MQITVEQAQTIGRIVREVAEVQANRLFKPEHRHQGDDILTILDAKIALAEIYRSLHLARIPLEILVQVDPHDIVIEKFSAAGYDVKPLMVVDDFDC